jgi:excisionase family DNA binding protein
MGRLCQHVLRTTRHGRGPRPIPTWMERTAVTDDRLLTPQEVCDYLGVSIRSFYNWRTENRSYPPAIKVGKHLRYRWSDLQTWLEEQSERVSA